jgi:hypothetical protein
VKPALGLGRPMTIRNELIDELLAGQDPSSVMRQDGLLGELKKALLNRLMAAEFEHHLAEDRASGESRHRRCRSRLERGRGCRERRVFRTSRQAWSRRRGRGVQSIDAHDSRVAPLRPIVVWFAQAAAPAIHA